MQVELTTDYDYLDVHRGSSVCDVPDMPTTKTKKCYTEAEACKVDWNIIS